jgi:hypothetical protein
MNMDANQGLHAAAWRKSSYSGGTNGECVQVADGYPALLPVRDSKDPHGPALTFTPAAWAAFLSHLKRNEQLSTTRA